MQKLLCERPLAFLKETQDLDVKKKKKLTVKMDWQLFQNSVSIN